MRRWRVSVSFDPRDLWVGVFWHRPTAFTRFDGSGQDWPLVIYVCLVPCLPIKFRHRMKGR